MTGERRRLLWALVYLIGLIGTQFLVDVGVLSIVSAEWVWLVILVIAGVMVDSIMGLRWTGSNRTLWMMLNGLFIVLSVTMVLSFWPGNESVLFALYFVLNGAGMLASGFEMRNNMWLGIGAVHLAFGLVLPTWFAAAPFLVSGLVLGVPLLISLWKMK